MVGHQKPDYQSPEASPEPQSTRQLVTRSPATTSVIGPESQDHQAQLLKELGFTPADIAKISASVPDLNVVVLVETPGLGLIAQLEDAVKLQEQQSLPVVFRHGSGIVVVNEGDTVQSLQAKIGGLELDSRQHNLVGASAAIGLIPSPMVDLPPDVQRDISALWDKMSEHFGISGPKPRFEYKADEGTAHYSSDTKTIVLGPNTVRAGTVWGEEIAHSLQDVAHPEASVREFTVEERAAQEFIGKLGSYLAKSIATPGMASEYFDPLQPESPWSSLETATREVRLYNTPDPSSLQAEVQTEILHVLRQTVRPIKSAIQNTLRNWLDGQCTDAIVAQEIRGHLETVEREGAKALDKLAQQPDSQAGLQGSMTELTKAQLKLAKASLRCLEHAFACQVSGTLKYTDVLQDIIDSTPRLYESLDGIIKIERHSIWDAVSDLHEASKDHRAWHAMGYAAAELFMKENPDWISQMPNLVIMSHREIYERFVKTERVLDLLKQARAAVDSE